MAVDVQQITGMSRSVSQLLSNSRYGLDFYQREYSWQEAQVGELIDDLASRFLDEFDAAHERRHVAAYRPYFLGPIVTAQRDGIRYLVDGQQRITTLSLLLIFLQRCLAESHKEEAEGLNSLIFSTTFGQKTFNLDVDEREKCLEAILDGRDFDASAEPESVRNLWDRYQTIVERFPSDLQVADRLPYYADWLQHRVILVEIGAPDQDMALEIFETMNDRGLRLSFGDMPYEDKVQHYNAQNPLARSLHPMAYENNPSFRRLREAHGLPFTPYPDAFTKADVDARQELYRQLAEIVWDPARILVDEDDKGSTL